MKKKSQSDNLTFAERHPMLNKIIGCVLLFGIGYLLYSGLDWLIHVTYTLLIKVSKMDAVVIVALITGAVSITGVIISSVVSKIIDYKKNRQEYLAQKREVPYMQFIEMYYRIIESSKESGNNYVQNEMVKDISKFNQQLTLWGSRDVVKKWIKFRANGQKKDAGQETIYLLEEILNAMRKDIGTKRMKKGDILSIFLNKE